MENATTIEREKRGADSGAAQGSASGWITDQLPDSDMTVLMKLSDAEFPIWPGFHDGEEWRSADSSTVSGPVLGWMELEDAAELLK